MEEGTILMPHNWDILQQTLEEQLLTIQKDEATIIGMATSSLERSSAFLNDLLIASDTYRLSKDEETLFFKTVMPHFLSQVLYFSKLLKIESLKPAATVLQLQQYYERQALMVAATFDEHRFIHNYLQSGSTYLDDRLFFKPTSIATYALSGWNPPIDGIAPICYDYVAAELLAAGKLSKYLLDALESLTLATPGHSTLPKLTWTAPKAHGIELGYALYAAGVFNNGKAQLKDIMECLEMAFHIKWGNYPRTMQEILYRKGGRTVFQDDMKNAYLLYIQRIEDKNFG